MLWNTVTLFATKAVKFLWCQETIGWYSKGGGVKETSKDIVRKTYLLNWNVLLDSSKKGAREFWTNIKVPTER